MTAIIVVFAFVGLFCLAIVVSQSTEEQFVKKLKHQADKLVRTNLGEDVHIDAHKLGQDTRSWILNLTYTNISGNHQEREVIAIEDRYEANKFNLYWNMPIGADVPRLDDSDSPNFAPLSSVYGDMSQLKKELARLNYRSGE